MADNYKTPVEVSINVETPSLDRSAFYNLCFITNNDVAPRTIVVSTLKGLLDAGFERTDLAYNFCVGVFSQRGITEVHIRSKRTGESYEEAYIADDNSSYYFVVIESKDLGDVESFNNFLTSDDGYKMHFYSSDSMEVSGSRLSHYYLGQEDGDRNYYINKAYGLVIESGCQASTATFEQNANPIYMTFSRNGGEFVTYDSNYMSEARSIEMQEALTLSQDKKSFAFISPQVFVPSGGGDLITPTRVGLAPEVQEVQEVVEVTAQRVEIAGIDSFGYYKTLDGTFSVNDLEGFYSDLGTPLPPYEIKSEENTLTFRPTSDVAPEDDAYFGLVGASVTGEPITFKSCSAVYLGDTSVGIGFNWESLPINAEVILDGMSDGNTEFEAEINGVVYNRGGSDYDLANALYGLDILNIGRTVDTLKFTNATDSTLNIKLTALGSQNDYTTNFISGFGDISHDNSGNNVFKFRLGFTAPVFEGLASDYLGTGWYKATDTGVVYCRGVPELDTHYFTNDPIEYTAVYDKYDIGNYESGAAISNVTDLSKLFKNQDVTFNVKSWDTSNVTRMDELFSGRQTFNQDIGHWDVSSVVNMSAMFIACFEFNQDISSWSTSLVEDMGYMFSGCYLFNKPLDSWDVSSVVDMGYMFRGSAFNQNLSSWDVSRVDNINYMFDRASEFNGDITTWNISNITKMNNTFNEATKFNQDISSWDVSNVNDMFGMFRLATTFNQNLSQWCVSNIESKPIDFDVGAASYSLPRPVWGSCPRGENGLPIVPIESEKGYMSVDLTGASGVYLTLSRDETNFTTFNLADPDFNPALFQAFVGLGQNQASGAFFQYPQILGEDALPNDVQGLSGMTPAGNVMTPRHGEGGYVYPLDAMVFGEVTVNKPFNVTAEYNTITAKATPNIPAEYDIYNSLAGATEGGVVKVVSHAVIQFAP